MRIARDPTIKKNDYIAVLYIDLLEEEILIM